MASANTLPDGPHQSATPPLLPIFEGWRTQALCLNGDPEIWYPEKGGTTREAVAVCDQCPVQEPCLREALVHDERFGVWGAKSERQRRRLRSRESLPRVVKPSQRGGTPAKQPGPAREFKTWANSKRKDVA